MKKHVIIKELGEGVVRSACNLLIMRYYGVKERYLADRSKEVSCNRCRRKYGIKE